jgi:hypothetical protein
MRDEIDGRLWQAHHAEYSATVAQAAASAGSAIGRLNRRLLAARWRRETIALFGAMVLAATLVTAAAGPVDAGWAQATAATQKGYVHA